MKILVVSGFLGAGKTTFIKELSRKTRRDFVVMENEYAQADIDRELLNEEKAVNIWELTEGCVCCSMKTDFASSILTIANTLDPEYLVVEPTGAAVLSRIIANIRQIEYERITLLRPITIVDADSFSLCLRDYRELFLDQLKTAGTIVVSRRSFSSEEEIRDFSKTLAEINPDASIQVPHYSHAAPSWWESLLSSSYDGGRNVPESSPETPDLETFSLYDISLPGSMQLLWFLENLSRGAFGKIVRAKGIVTLPDTRLRFDLSNGLYSITGFAGDGRSNGVFIGTGIRRAQIRKLLVPGFLDIPSAPGDSSRKQILRLPRQPRGTQGKHP